MGNNAYIFDIKRFAVHDGEGIRTTVFIKGCPLNCIWCHNPEGKDPNPQIAYYQDRCILCGECISVCPVDAHAILENGHTFLREKCIVCGKCEGVCLGGALKLYGKKMSPDEVLPLLLMDKDFYSDGGGVTLSGGECLCQADFCAELLKILKENGTHTAVDTAGNVPREAFDKVIPYTDLFLYDIKAIDEKIHIEGTGQSNKLIIENLKYLNARSVPVEIRIPFIPGFNDNQIEKIAGFLRPLKNIKSVKVLPYHNYAKSKYDALGMKNTLNYILPTSEEIKNAAEILDSITGSTSL